MEEHFKEQILFLKTYIIHDLISLKNAHPLRDH
jgi:hypothetical protein